MEYENDAESSARSNTEVWVLQLLLPPVILNGVVWLIDSPRGRYS